MLITIPKENQYFRFVKSDALEIQLKSLPEVSGVYQYYDRQNKIIYIGKAKNLKKRVASYFNKSFDNEKLNSLDESIDAERFTSIDIRIYDLEKDIKNLTLQFEEILFKLDDISNDMVDLESKLISKFEKSNIELRKENIENNKAATDEDLEIEEKNTLGKIVIR